MNKKRVKVKKRKLSIKKLLIFILVLIIISLLGYYICSLKISNIYVINNNIINDLKNIKNVYDLNTNLNTVILTYQKGENNIEELIDYLKTNKIKYNRIFAERPTLNDVFLELTGKELRD